MEFLNNFVWFPNGHEYLCMLQIVCHFYIPLVQFQQERGKKIIKVQEKSLVVEAKADKLYMRRKEQYFISYTNHSSDRPLSCSKTPYCLQNHSQTPNSLAKSLSINSCSLLTSITPPQAVYVISSPGTPCHTKMVCICSP